MPTSDKAATMTADEHAHMQKLEGLVKRYRSRIVALKQADLEPLRLLVAQWRNDADRDSDVTYRDYAITLRHCADELEEKLTVYASSAMGGHA